MVEFLPRHTNSSNSTHNVVLYLVVRSTRNEGTSNRQRSGIVATTWSHGRSHRPDIERRVRYKEKISWQRWMPQTFLTV